VGAESVHKKLDRVRKPRVHITYEVETEGAVVLKELPFVVGIMSDLTGNAPGEKVKPLRDRKFVQIDRDNFNDVMAKMKPGLNIRVENKLAKDGTEMPVQLQFKSLDSFSPAEVAKQVPALDKLLDTRNKLRDLMTKIDRSENLESILDDVLKNTDKLQKLQDELGVKAPES
jgi:type VI secretion system protein ImpB